jgi:hypothetical protein
MAVIRTVAAAARVPERPRTLSRKAISIVFDHSRDLKNRTPEGTQIARSRAEVKGMAKRSSTKRELIDTSRNKSYAKRDVQGQFREMDDVGRSLATDRRGAAKTTVKAGHGDQGDRPRAAVKKR